MEIYSIFQRENCFSKRNKFSFAFRDMIKTRKSNRYFSNIVDAKSAVTERHPTKKNSTWKIEISRFLSINCSFMAGRLILNTKYRWLYCNMIMKPFQLSTRFLLVLMKHDYMLNSLSHLSIWIRLDRDSLSCHNANLVN